jgi:hypothetical protein
MLDLSGPLCPIPNSSEDSSDNGPAILIISSHYLGHVLSHEHLLLWPSFLTSPIKLILTLISSNTMVQICNLASCLVLICSSMRVSTSLLQHTALAENSSVPSYDQGLPEDEGGEVIAAVSPPRGQKRCIAYLVLFVFPQFPSPILYSIAKSRLWLSDPLIFLPSIPP